MEKSAFIKSQERFMRMALAQARMAAREGEVPVGAVVVKDGCVIAAAHNQREADSDPAGHAELIALRRAAHVLGGWQLAGCQMYVTLEPCPMCAGAIALSRLDAVVFGAFDPAMGCAGSAYALCQDRRFGPGVAVAGGVLEEPCTALLKDFFAQQRKRKEE